jgi:flagellar biogenesis protein FliO
MKRVRAWLLAGAVVLGAGTGGACAQQAAPAASAAGGTGAIPFKREPVAAGDTASRTLVALVLVLAVGGAAIWLLRKRQGGGGLLSPGAGAGQRLQVLETRRIGAKGTLVVVRWNAEELLLSHGEGGTTLIARAPGATPAQEAA